MKFLSVSFLITLLSSSYASQAAFFVELEDAKPQGMQVWKKVELSPEERKRFFNEQKREFLEKIRLKVNIEACERMDSEGLENRYIDIEYFSKVAKLLEIENCDNMGVGGNPDADTEQRKLLYQLLSSGMFPNDPNEMLHFKNSTNKVLKKFNKIDTRFRRLKSQLPRDMDLILSHARFLWNHGKMQESLDEFSKVILLEHSDNHYGEFMQTIQFIEIDGVFLAEYINSLHTIIENPLQYAKDHHLFQGIKRPDQRAGQQQLNVKITSSSVEEGQKLFNVLKGFSTNCHDAVLKITLSHMPTEMYLNSAPLLIKSLFKNNDNPSPLVKQFYADHWLAPAQHFQEAVNVYEAVVGTNLDVNNVYQNFISFQNLSTYYISQVNATLYVTPEGKEEYQYSPSDIEKIKKALNVVELSASCEDVNSIMLYNHLSILQIYLKRYEEALENLKKIINKPREEFKAAGSNIKSIKNIYRRLLHVTGYSDEAGKILYEKQKKILEKNKKIAHLIKYAQEHQQEMQQIQDREQAHQKAQAESLQQKKQTVRLSPPREEGSGQPPKGNNDRLIPKPPKKKTRNPAHQQQPEANKQPVKISNQPSKDVELEKFPITPGQFMIYKGKPLIFIEALTSNKKAQKTFYKLFDIYKYGKETEIRQSRVEDLMTALKQNVKKETKSSHQQGVLDFRNVGLDGEKIVFGLTSQVILKEWQNKNCRKGFVSGWRIVPNDLEIIKKLDKAGLLD